MALIVEIVDARGGAVRTRVRLDGLPMSIGRGYDNDLILDDVYVDAKHARINVNADGTVEVEDLGSINGLIAVDEAERVPRIVAQAGTQVRVGRTILRFRDPSEPVPPALKEAVHAAPFAMRLIAQPWVRLVLCVGAIGLVSLYTWLSSYERDSTSTVVAVAVGFTLLGMMWSAGWAVASRVAVNRFNFIGHLTIFSALVIPMMLFTTLVSWAAFMAPGNPLSVPVGVAAWFAASTVSIALHLSLASNLKRSRRWRAGAITTGVMVVVTGLLTYAGNEMFTDVPEFSGALKPVPNAMLPMIDVADFSEVVAELAEQADDLAED